MRKSLIITLLLLILSAGALIFAHRWVDKAKDAVTLDESVLYGDKAFAEGLTVICSTQCDDHLFWNTGYTVGDAPGISTDFEFSQTEKRSDYTRSYRGVAIYDGVFTGYGMSSSSGIGMEEMALPIRDVASRTAPGAEHTEEVFVKDYYNNYPLSVEIDLPGSGTAVNERTLGVFANYFRIPVWAEHKAAITIQKDTEGMVYSMGISPVEGHDVSIGNESVITDTGCFFTLSVRTSTGRLLDTSRITGGYGIYYFPYYTKSDMAVPVVSALDMVYPVDPDQAEIIGLQTSADKSELFLITIENGTFMLTVIDTETVTQRQKLTLFDAQDRSFSPLFVYDDFIVPVFGNRFAVVTETAAGEYALQFTADTAQTGSLKFDLLRNSVMDYDGKRLAVATFLDINMASSFYLTVFDRNGLAYCGKYEHSLDKGLFDYTNACKPVDREPLTVQWGGSFLT